jgi:hypothetical protein
MSDHDLAEVRMAAEYYSTNGSIDTANMLYAYADSIERSQKGVTKEVEERAYKAFCRAGNRVTRGTEQDCLRAALLAVWPSVAAQPEPASEDAEDMDHRSPEHLTGYALLRLLDECRKVPGYEGDESFNDAIAYVDRVIGQAARAAKGGE